MIRILDVVVGRLLVRYSKKWGIVLSHLLMWWLMMHKLRINWVTLRIWLIVILYIELTDLGILILLIETSWLQVCPLERWLTWNLSHKGRNLSVLVLICLRALSTYLKLWSITWWVTWNTHICKLLIRSWRVLLNLIHWYRWLLYESHSFGMTLYMRTHVSFVWGLHLIQCKEIWPILCIKASIRTFS